MATGALDSAGGCYNGSRYGLAPTANTRTWKHPVNSTTLSVYIESEILIIAGCWDGDDMNTAVGAGWQLQWRNVSDAGSFADLAATGEIKWASGNLTDEQALISAEQAHDGSIDCTGKGWSAFEGFEVADDYNIDFDGNDDVLIEVHWAVDISGADTANGDEYEFKFRDEVPSDWGVTLGKFKAIIEGKIDGVTKNDDRTSAVGGVTVTIYESDGAGSDPKPIGDAVAQVVSHATTGVYSVVGLAKDAGYFLHFYKDDTADLSDGSPEVTAVAL